MVGGRKLQIGTLFFSAAFPPLPLAARKEERRRERGRGKKNTWLGDAVRCRRRSLSQQSKIRSLNAATHRLKAEHPEQRARHFSVRQGSLKYTYVSVTLFFVPTHSHQSLHRIRVTKGFHFLICLETHLPTPSPTRFEEYSVGCLREWIFAAPSGSEENPPILQLIIIPSRLDFLFIASLLAQV